MHQSPSSHNARIPTLPEWTHTLNINDWSAIDSYEDLKQKAVVFVAPSSTFSPSLIPKLLKTKRRVSNTVSVRVASPKKGAVR